MCVERGAIVRIKETIGLLDPSRQGQALCLRRAHTIQCQIFYVALCCLSLVITGSACCPVGLPRDWIWIRVCPILFLLGLSLVFISSEWSTKYPRKLQDLCP